MEKEQEQEQETFDDLTQAYWFCKALESTIELMREDMEMLEERLNDLSLAFKVRFYGE